MHPIRRKKNREFKLRDLREILPMNAQTFCSLFIIIKLNYIHIWKIHIQVIYLQIKICKLQLTQHGDCVRYPPLYNNMHKHAHFLNTN